MTTTLAVLIVIITEIPIFIWAFVKLRKKWIAEASGAIERAQLAQEGEYAALVRGKHLEDQLRQSQKMDAVGRLAGGVAHDFNNLLTVIITYCEFISTDKDSSADTLSNVSHIKSAAERAASLTRQLLAFSRQQVLQLTNLNLNDLVHGLQPMLARLIVEHIKIEMRLMSEPAIIRADKSQIEQVILNLCINAADAMSEGGTLTLETSRGMEGEIILRVIDTGHGIPADILTKVFDPFFTTKPQGRGTGLGLSTVYGIVKQLDGRIDIQSVPDEGATFTITFGAAATPVASTNSNAIPAAPIIPAVDELNAVPAKPPKGSETILLVEDDHYLRKAVLRMLEQLGYSVVPAVNGNDAVEVVETFPGTIDLILTDLMLPEMNGLELLNRMFEIIPGVRVLLMTGYTDEDIIGMKTVDIHHPLILKPFTQLDLARKLREVLA